MGVCTFLVSDASKKWLDLGKIFFDEEALDRIRQSGASAREISARIQDEDFNAPSSAEEADAAAETVAAWMRAHPDWRFLSEVDDGFDDVFLAEDAEDAEEYLSEAFEDPRPIYVKDGSVSD